MAQCGHHSLEIAGEHFLSAPLKVNVGPESTQGWARRSAGRSPVCTTASGGRKVFLEKESGAAGFSQV